MSKPKDITVYLRCEKRKKQPWSFTIDYPGGGTDLNGDDRFSAESSAKRCALGKLDALCQRNHLHRPSGISGWIINGH